MADMKLFLELLIKNAGFRDGLNKSGSDVSRFTQGAKREFDALRGSMQSVQGVIAGLGLSYGFIQNQAMSARLDKGLMQVKQTAGETAGKMKEVRQEFFRMGGETGQQVEELKNGFDSLIQSGQTWKSALESTRGVNIASAVTGVKPEALSGALSIAGNQFEIDLEKPGKALELLDKMTVAGRLGNAELGTLADSFSRFSNNATRAGFTFEKTLAFAEALSYAEKNPERLGTLVDSTLRVFTNLKYMSEAQGASGIKFFDDKGGRRDPVAVLEDVRKKYGALKTDAQRANFMQAAFGKMDLDTQKGMDTVLKKAAIPRINDFTKQIENAGGTLQRDLPDAINNAVDQTGRLKIVLRQAADEFAQPINKAIANGIKYLINPKADGGKGLTGNQLAGGAVIATVAGVLAYRYGGKAISGLIRSAGGVAAGVAEGKALEAAAGITPVFVTNFPASLGGSAAAQAIGGAAAGAGGAKAAGWLARSGRLVLGSNLVAASMSVVPQIAAAGAVGYGAYSFGSMLERNLIKGRVGADIYDLFHPQDMSAARNGAFSGGNVKNDIKLEVRIDNAGRIIAVSNDTNTNVDTTVHRGAFDSAIMSSGL